MDISLTKRLTDKMKPRERVRGRYNASELYGIVNGWTTPEQWISPAERKWEEILLMWNGIGIHNQVQEVLGEQFSEHKKVYEYRGINLVAKADFLPPHKPNQVWEFKTSDSKMKKAKPWHLYQAKLYASMFEKDEAVVFQPICDKTGFILFEIGTVNRDDLWFREEMKKLYSFHLKVERLYKDKLKKENETKK